MKKKENKVYGLLDEIEDEVMPRKKINRTSLPKGSEKVDLENVVSISEEALKKVLRRTDKATRHIAADLLENEIPMLLSYDHATSYAETVLRDGLSIDVEIDDDITRVLSYLNKLSIVYQYTRMVKLPKAVRRLFVEELTKALVPKAVDAMEKSANTRKYSQNLRELVATVSQNGENTDEIKNQYGVKKTRKA